MRASDASGESRYEISVTINYIFVGKELPKLVVTPPKSNYIDNGDSIGSTNQTSSSEQEKVVNTKVDEALELMNNALFGDIDGNDMDQGTNETSETGQVAE